MRQMNGNLRLSFFVVTGLLVAVLTCWSAFHQLQNIHFSYWGAEGQSPQGTIYAVQTVHFNTANTSMPFAAAQALLKKDREYLQSLTDSAFGLSGFIITECGDGSTSEVCGNEKPIAFTKLGYGWINQNNLHEFIQSSDYATLFQDHAIGVDWQYRAPKDDKIINLEFEGNGEVIGRIYYVRRPSPSFSEQWSAYLSNLGSSDSMAIKYFTAVILTHAVGFLAFLALLCLIYRKAIENLKIQQEKEVLDVWLDDAKKQLEANQTEKLSLESQYSKAVERLSGIEIAEASSGQHSAELEGQVRQLRQQLEVTFKASEEGEFATNELLEDIESELKRLEADCNESKRQHRSKVEELEKLGPEVATMKAQMMQKDSELDESYAEIVKLQKELSGRTKKASIAEVAVNSFVDGLNIKCHGKLLLHDDIRKDIQTLESKNYSHLQLIDVISRLMKIDESDANFARTFEKLKDFDFLYHSKKAAIRVYFKRKDGKTLLLGLWEQGDAPHTRNDKKWKLLRSRLDTALDLPPLSVTPSASNGGKFKGRFKTVRRKGVEPVNINPL